MGGKVYSKQINKTHRVFSFPSFLFFFKKKKCIVGKMVLELGDSCVVRCRTSDLVCELDFKTKVTGIEYFTKRLEWKTHHWPFYFLKYKNRDFFLDSIMLLQERLKKNPQVKSCMKYPVNGLMKSILKWQRYSSC